MRRTKAGAPKLRTAFLMPQYAGFIRRWGWTPTWLNEHFGWQLDSYGLSQIFRGLDHYPDIIKKIEQDLYSLAVRIQDEGAAELKP